MHVQAAMGKCKRYSSRLHCLRKHLPGVPLGLVDLQCTHTWSAEALPGTSGTYMPSMPNNDTPSLSGYRTFSERHLL